MNLSLQELAQSRFAELVNNLRKHSVSEIAVAAKQLRMHLKQQVCYAILNY
jgi:hypothetical protein